MKTYQSNQGFTVIEGIVAITVIGIIVVTVMVLTRPQSNPNDHPQGSDETMQSEDCIDLSHAIQNLESYIPTWDELECHINKTPRLAVPTFAKRVLTSSEKFGIQSGLPTLHKDNWDTIHQTYDANLSSINLSSMPPYIDDNGQALTYPVDEKYLDRQIRSYATFALYYREQGLSSVLVNFYPPHKPFAEFSTVEEARTWIDNVHIPEKIREAKLAEKMGVEYYVPFPIEIEIFWNSFFQPTLNMNYDQTTLVTLAQEMLDKTLTAVRKEYTGRLMVYSAHWYEDNDPWQNLSFAGYDEVGFTLFPECDLATTKTFFDTQLAVAQNTARRDNIDWSIGEFELKDDLYQACDTDLSAIQSDIYQYFFDKLNAAQPAPIGLSVAQNSDLGIVNAFWKTR